jgi:hypothetical protein
MEAESASTMPPRAHPGPASIDINMSATGLHQPGTTRLSAMSEQTIGNQGPSYGASSSNPASEMIPDSIASAMAPTTTPISAFMFESLPSGAPAYNEMWENSLMEYMLDGRKRDMAKKRLADAQGQMQLGIGPPGLNMQNLPTPSGVEGALNPLSSTGQGASTIQPSSPGLEVKLPLPLDHPLRGFSFQAPHAHASNLPFLTHPHGSLYGGPSPFPSHDASAFAADIIDAYDFKHKSAMTRYIHKDLNKHIDDLERKMKARKAARDSNERVKKALKELEKERALEVKAMERWRVEMARKARIKGGGHKGIGGR